MGGDEAEEEPVEERRRLVVETSETGGIEGASLAEAADLGQERPSSEDEEGDGVGQPSTFASESLRHPGAALGGDPLSLVPLWRLALEGTDEGGKELPAVGPEGSPGTTRGPSELRSARAVGSPRGTRPRPGRPFRSSHAARSVGPPVGGNEALDACPEGFEPQSRGRPPGYQ